MKSQHYVKFLSIAWSLLDGTVTTKELCVEASAGRQPCLPLACRSRSLWEPRLLGKVLAPTLDSSRGGSPQEGPRAVPGAGPRAGPQVRGGNMSQ